MAPPVLMLHFKFWFSKIFDTKCLVSNVKLESKVQFCYIKHSCVLTLEHHLVTYRFVPNADLWGNIRIARLHLLNRLLLHRKRLLRNLRHRRRVHEELEVEIWLLRHMREDVLKLIGTRMTHRVGEVEGGDAHFANVLACRICHSAGVIDACIVMRTRIVQCGIHLL